MRTAAVAAADDPYGQRLGQSLPLLQSLHILTRDGKLNQDSRRKLKQIYHLHRFIEPLLRLAVQQHGQVHVVDHAAGKSSLGFLLYDLFFRAPRPAPDTGLATVAPANAPLGSITCVERRADLVQAARQRAHDFGFGGMRFLELDIANATQHPQLPARIDVVTALHACDSATDDVISFALAHKVRALAIVPCCQAEVARHLRASKAARASHPTSALNELWRRPLHTREFGSHLTNVLRCLRLEASGYKVQVTELTGWEHAIKNELILAQRVGPPQAPTAAKLNALLQETGLGALALRFAPLIN